MKVATIVEGDGEVLALPILLRRLVGWRSPEHQPDILMPIRVRRDRFINKSEECERHFKLAAAKCGLGGWVLVVLDADDDCPAQLATELIARAQSWIPHRRVSIVLAKREFEAWFIAAAQSLDGFRGFVSREERTDPELPRDAKGWIKERIAGNRYGETTDQPAFAARFDLQQAFDGSRSFRKLCSEWDRHTQGAAISDL